MYVMKSIYMYGLVVYLNNCKKKRKLSIHSIYKLHKREGERINSAASLNSERPKEEKGN